MVEGQVLSILLSMVWNYVNNSFKDLLKGNNFLTFHQKILGHLTWNYLRLWKNF